MRPIKFRAWDKQRKIMSLVSTISFGDDGSALTISFNQANNKTNQPREYYMGLVHGENGILMQFTGLKDKNGKEIYEGDIVKDEFGVDVVHFYEGEFKKKSGESCGCSIGRLGTKDMEVIGNIYENPELFIPLVIEKVLIEKVLARLKNPGLKEDRKE